MLDFECLSLAWPQRLIVPHVRIALLVLERVKERQKKHIVGLRLQCLQLVSITSRRRGLLACLGSSHVYAVETRMRLMTHGQLHHGSVSSCAMEAVICLHSCGTHITITTMQGTSSLSWCAHIEQPMCVFALNLQLGACHMTGLVAMEHGGNGCINDGVCV